ncbi:MAG: HAMP domain-containing histidine kinase [Pseudomonadota bacterium]|nr:HAMP domain-containing histidine kinase [Pseudomonadota bacterium]
MASRPTEPVPISGTVDRDGRLIAADTALERLQVEAGSALGRQLALPQLAALARAAAALGVPLSRALIAADCRHDLELFVRAEPKGDEVELTIERWASRPAAPPRLTLVESTIDDERPQAASGALEFETDAALNLIHVSADLAALLGRNPDDCLGQPLTALFRLIEEEDGSMPLLAALSSRGPVDGQRAVGRGPASDELRIDAEPVSDPAGKFAGFHGAIRRGGEMAVEGRADAPPFEDTLDEALRSPLSLIISAADRIVERSDGPLRSDYAHYASDIAAAGRHLLSVIRSMGDVGAGIPQQVDLRELAIEAVALVQPLADANRIELAMEASGVLHADGEARAIVQILVNIIGNAIRHSPAEGVVAILFEQDANDSRVTIADQGPGIAEDDQQRIFERYERVGDAPDGSGLGLAIARRLARSMGGDISLASTAGEGARFTLVLPA